MGAIGAVHQHDARLPDFRLGLVHAGIGDDDHQIVFLGQARGGAVDADHARTRGRGDGIGRKAVAIVDVQHIDLLMGQDAGAFQEREVHADGAFIVKVALGHRRAVNLALEKRQLHQLSKNDRSLRDRDGCLSLRSALASIWRIRSRVTLNCWPTSSSV